MHAVMVLVVVLQEYQRSSSSIFQKSMLVYEYRAFKARCAMQAASDSPFVKEDWILALFRGTGILNEVKPARIHTENKFILI